MHKLLSDWIDKLGIKPGEMSEEEKETFDSYNAILSEEDITVEKIAEFCKRQQSAIEVMWIDKNRDRTNDAYLADMHTTYGLIAKMITAKKMERVALEEKLSGMLDGKTNSNV